MSSWRKVRASSPDLAAAVEAIFEARRHKVMATLRADGSPRLSGIETSFHDGEVWLGMMPGSRKADDLRRDPRVAVHAASDDPPEDDPRAWPGDAKLSGRTIEETPAERPDAREDGPEAVWFRVEVNEVVLTRVGDPPDHLDIQTWRDGEVRRFERR